jgi:lipooligosaccharide transport system permease protein
MLLVPPHRRADRLRLRGVRHLGQRIVPSIDSFGYVISAVLTPLFLVAGTFFPVDGLPGGRRRLAQLNPLFHCVELVRAAVFGLSAGDLVHVLALAVFAVAMWLLAVRRLRTRLVL